MCTIVQMMNRILGTSQLECGYYCTAMSITMTETQTNGIGCLSDDTVHLVSTSIDEALFAYISRYRSTTAVLTTSVGLRDFFEHRILGLLPHNRGQRERFQICKSCVKFGLKMYQRWLSVGFYVYPPLSRTHNNY